MMNVNEVYLLSQLITSIEQLEKKLEDFYNQKDSDNFEKTKKEMLNLHTQISKIIK